MKLKFFPILTMLVAAVFIAISACAGPLPSKDKGRKAEKPVCEKWIHPDSMAYSHLGRTLTDILFNPKKVKAYSVELQDSTNQGNAIVESGFVVGKPLHDLDKQQIAVVDFLLPADGRNYSVDSIKPMIAHRPTIAFEFSNKTGHAIMWYSPDDFTWGIRYDDKQTFKFNVCPQCRGGLIRFCNNLNN